MKSAILNTLVMAFITLLSNMDPYNITIGCWELKLILNFPAQLFKYPAIIFQGPMEQEHNINQIHNCLLWDWHYLEGLTLFSGIFLTNWMWGIFCKILSIPQNIVMNLNNVMSYTLSNIMSRKRSPIFFIFLFFWRGDYWVRWLGNTTLVVVAKDRRSMGHLRLSKFLW